MPSFIDLSHDDRFSIEISSEFPTSVLLRNLVTNSLIAKFEGHSQTVTSLQFVTNQKESYNFVSCAGSECLFWQTPAEALANNSASKIHEVLQPTKILDSESSQSILDVQALQVMKGAFLVLATADRQQFVFMVKVGSKNKSKVKKADSLITLGIKQHEIAASSIIDDR